MVFAKPQKAGCSLGLRSKRFVHHGWVAHGEKKKFAEISGLYKTPSENILSLLLVELNQLNKSRSDYKIKPKCLHRRDIFIAYIK